MKHLLACGAALCLLSACLVALAGCQQPQDATISTTKSTTTSSTESATSSSTQSATSSSTQTATSNSTQTATSSSTQSTTTSSTQSTTTSSTQSTTTSSTQSTTSSSSQTTTTSSTQSTTTSTTTSTTEWVLPEVSDGDFGSNGTLPLANVAFTNPLDDRIAQVVDGDEDLVVMSRGEKDANGTALAVTQLDIQNLTTGVTTAVNYDINGLPSKAASGDTTLIFQWGNGSVSILAASGDITILTNIDLNDTDSDASSTPNTSSEAASASTNSTEGRRLSEFSSSLLDPTVTLTLVGCTGVPVTTENVFMELWTDADGDGEYEDGHSWSVSPAEGVYTRKLPLKPSSLWSVSEICRAVQKGSDKVCKLMSNSAKKYTAMCATLTATVAVANPGAAAAVAAACASLLVGARVYCAAVGWVLDDFIFDPLCEALEGVVDRHLKDQPTRIIIRVNGESQASRDFPGAPSDWSTSLTVPSAQAKLLGFITDPLDPDPEENYVAEVEVDCLKPGSEIRLFVVGTDGYEDHTVCNYSAGAVLGRCSLFVPGAAIDVIDTITVWQYEQGSGYTELSSIVIIF